MGHGPCRGWGRRRSCRVRGPTGAPSSGSPASQSTRPVSGIGTSRFRRNDRPRPGGTSPRTGRWFPQGRSVVRLARPGWQARNRNHPRGVWSSRTRPPPSGPRKPRPRPYRPPPAAAWPAGHPRTPRERSPPEPGNNEKRPCSACKAKESLGGFRTRQWHDGTSVLSDLIRFYAGCVMEANSENEQPGALMPAPREPHPALRRDRSNPLNQTAPPIR